METLKELVAAAGAHDGAVIDAADRSAPYSYGEFATNSFKAGTLLGHYGVHPGSAVTVAVGPKERPEEARDGPAAIPDSAEPLLAMLGGASIGATVDLTPVEPAESRALVFPAWQAYEAAPRCSRLAYGGPPEDPSVAHFETELWSENPTEPPETVEPTDVAVRASGDAYTHEALLAEAEAIVERYGLEETSRVGLAAPLTDPGAVVAGVLAPLSAGATISLPGEAGTGSAWTDAGAEAPTLRVVETTESGTQENGQRVVAGDVTASLRDTGRA